MFAHWHLYSQKGPARDQLPTRQSSSPTLISPTASASASDSPSILNSPLKSTPTPPSSPPHSPSTSKPPSPQQPLSYISRPFLLSAQPPSPSRHRSSLSTDGQVWCRSVPPVSPLSEEPGKEHASGGNNVSMRRRRMPGSRGNSSKIMFATNKLTTPPYPGLHNQFRKVDQHPVAWGSFSDIYRGISTANDEMVAIKVLRIPGYKHENDNDLMDAIKSRLHHEIKMWRLLTNPNVLSFLGFSYEFGRFPALISPFCPNRDVVTYLKRHPDADRRLIALGVTCGLSYLHSREAIHGDLRTRNVLIDSKGEALICDFGVSRIIGCRSFTTNLAGTLPFMAPELFPDEDNDVPLSYTKETDIWAFGLVLLEVFTGKEPNPKIRPYGPSPHPKHRYYNPISDQLWELAEACCDLDHTKRPTMEVVMQRLPLVDVRSEVLP